jgi:hypothetical protein
MLPTRDQELAVLRSVVYASLFDYPLTLAQLESSLIGVRAEAPAIASWLRNSEFLQCAIEHRDGLFFPTGRADLVATRARREALSRELLDRDRRILTVIACMPFVRMAALSGSLAHLNAEGSADLDLFVITAPHRVWSVTVATLVLSKLLGCRRHLCMNYVVSEQALEIAPQDLFSANQIIHLRPMTGHRVFERFVKANPFVRDFYPNFELGTEYPEPHAPHLRQGYGGQASPKSQAPSPKPRIERLLSFGAAQLLERVARSLYGWHLRRKAASWHSRDQVRLEPECLKLHTSSHRGETMARFERAMDDLMRGTEQNPREVGVLSR